MSVKSCAVVAPAGGKRMPRICKECGGIFFMDEGEIMWYRRKELNLPCRCHPCRKGINKYAGLPEAVRNYHPAVRTGREQAYASSNGILDFV